MPRPQLHSFELRLLAVLDDGWNIPTFRQVVSDQANMHLRGPHDKARLSHSSRFRGQLRQTQRAHAQPRCLQEMPTIDVHACRF